MTSTHLPAHAPVSVKVQGLEDFRLALEQQRQFRLEQLDELAGASLASSPATEARDEVRDILMASARAALTEIEAALNRLHAGRYGRCERCATAISNERLEVLPMSRYCMSCQHSVESGRLRIASVSGTQRRRAASVSPSPVRRTP
jgi:DnaK suppressor protein